MNTKQYITLTDALSVPGAQLLERDLRAEYDAGKITFAMYLHLAQEKRLVAEWRSYKERADKFVPVQLERQPDEGLL